MTTSAVPSYAGYRFPAEVISHAVWLYFRFPLSLRMVDELLTARGIVVSYETVRPDLQAWVLTMLVTNTPNGIAQPRPVPPTGTPAADGAVLPWRPRAPWMSARCLVPACMLFAGACGGRAAAVEPSLATFACTGFVGGFTIREPDGRWVSTADGRPSPSLEPTFIQVDRAARSIAVAGASMPRTGNDASPSLVSADPIRFAWGTVRYEMLGKGETARTLRGRAESTIDSGPDAGRVMEMGFVKSCTVVPAADFPTSPPSRQ